MSQHFNINEKELLYQVREGDQGAFGILFKKYYAQMVNIAAAMLPDTDTAENVTQDAFVKVWRELTNKNLAITHSFYYYLRKAVVNTALNHIKQMQRGPELFSEDDLENEVFQIPDSADMDEKADDTEGMTLEERLYAAIKELPPRCQTIIMLHKIHGYSHKEIAEELDISTKTIENQITKGMKHLRNVLIRYKNLVLTGIIIIAISEDYIHFTEWIKLVLNKL